MVDKVKDLHVRLVSDMNLSVTLAKVKRKFWSRLSTEKDPQVTVHVDWTYWQDYDSDSNQTYYSEGVPAETGDRYDGEMPLPDLSGAPCLVDGLSLNSEAALFFRQIMTLSQRMQTLVVMWNMSDYSERKNMISTLVEKLLDNDLDKEKMLQGECLLPCLTYFFLASNETSSMPESYYGEGGAVPPAAWLKQFGALEAESRVDVLKGFYETLSPEEKRLVIDTLVY